jgi:hypothetical protein
MGFFIGVGLLILGIAAKAAAAVKIVAACLKVAVVAIRTMLPTIIMIYELLKELGLLKENEKPEEIGDRCKQAEEAGIDRTKFNTFEEYEKAIREFKLDPEKSKNISSDDKYRYFLGFSSMMVEEKLRNKFDDFVKFAKCLTKFDDLKVFSKEIYETFKEKDLPLGKIDNFFNKDLKTSEDIAIEKALVEAWQKKEPEKTIDDILNEFKEMKKSAE